MGMSQDKVKRILQDKEMLQRFVFFFNKAENVRVESSKIKQALVKLVSNESEREMLEYEGRVVFVDSVKIETIHDVIVNKSTLKLPITLQEFKRKYHEKLLSNDEWGKRYREFISAYEEGDVIFEFVSSYRTWKQLHGRSFVVLYRQDECIVTILKSMN
jgi:hypothetical protein